MFEYTPTLKQAKFLASNADILLFGGGAGSGKTLTALVHALRLNEPGGAGYANPTYNALICRKHYRDLRDIIIKSNSIYPLLGATYNKSDMIWTFPSGALIQIAYFDTLDRCSSMTQGAEYNECIIDEAMHFESDEIMMHLISRLRSTNSIKPQMILTSNPGPHKWLRDFFRINEKGDSTKFNKEYVLEDSTIIKKKIEYIQARLIDNPYLPKEYEAQLMMLPEQQRQAFLFGDWSAFDSIDGQILEHELKAMKDQNRICHLAHDPAIPVVTVWDIGMSDLSVILFVQFVGKEIRIIDMIKDNNKGLQDYIAMINARKQDKGYQYKMHYLPHDSSKRDYGNAISIADQAKAVLRDVKQLPRLPLKDGIHMMRAMCKDVWIDKELDLYDDLVHYKREYDDKMMMFKDSPVHDKYSHSADAFRMISYIKVADDAVKPALMPKINPFA